MRALHAHVCCAAALLYLHPRPPATCRVLVCPPHAHSNTIPDVATCLRTSPVQEACEAAHGAARVGGLELLDVPIADARLPLVVHGSVLQRNMADWCQSDAVIIALTLSGTALHGVIASQQLGMAMLRKVIKASVGLRSRGMFAGAQQMTAMAIWAASCNAFSVLGSKAWCPGWTRRQL